MKEVQVIILDSEDEAEALLESQRKEIALLKHRAETAEANFIAIIGRLQDFRTSLRSEIHTMPPGIGSNGLPKLSAAMEMAIDDAGLYLRTISDGLLKQSRTNWEIHYGTQTENSTSTSMQRSFQSQSPAITHPTDTKGKRKETSEVEGVSEETWKKIRKINEDGKDQENKKTHSEKQVKGNEAIMSRPLIAAVPKKSDSDSQKSAHIHRSRPRRQLGSGHFFDKPCIRCTMEKTKCEKVHNGEACLMCRIMKCKCSHIQAKKMVDSDNEDQTFVDSQM